MKHPKTCFVIDLHPCANYKHLQKLWDNYMMVDRESVEVLLSFIHHHLVNHSMISFTIQDFRVCSVPYPFVKAVSADIVKDAPIDPNAQAMCYGLCFEQACGLETSYVNAFAKLLTKLMKTSMCYGLYSTRQTMSSRQYSFMNVNSNLIHFHHEQFNKTTG